MHSIVLVDDHAVVRAGLTAVLGSAKDIPVVGEGSSGQDAIALAERVDTAVLMMDLSMGQMDGPTATLDIGANRGRAKIPHLTERSGHSYPG